MKEDLLNTLERLQRHVTEMSKKHCTLTQGLVTITSIAFYENYRMFYVCG